APAENAEYFVTRNAGNGRRRWAILRRAERKVILICPEGAARRRVQGKRRRCRAGLATGTDLLRVLGYLRIPLRRDPARSLRRLRDGDGQSHIPARAPRSALAAGGNRLHGGDLPRSAV